MSVTLATVRRGDVAGNQRVTVTDVTFDASYPTGGLALTAKDLGLNTVQHAICDVQVRGANGPISAVYDIANAKIKALTGTGEVANATSLATAVARVTAFGF